MSNKKIAIVTGASRGIGRATALKLARQGYALAINYRSQSQAAEEVAALARDEGVEALAIAADVSTEAGVLALFEQVDRQLGTLTALVNNAGVLDTQARVAELSEQRIARIMQTNVTGPFLCCREAVLRMSTANGGSGGAIVNVSSAASRLGAPGEYVDYAASKAALDTLTLGLAKEVAAEGIRVNCVRPGLIYTDIHADGGEPGRVDRLKSSLPMQRGGKPEEVADGIAYLLSDEASYITGSFLDMAGGR